MKKQKRCLQSIIALILAMVMVVGTPVGVLADNEILTEDATVVSPADGSETVSESTISDDNVGSDKIGFELTNEQMEDKMGLASVLSDMAGMESGKDYVADEVYFVAEDEEAAEKVADAYDTDLTSFDYGIGTLSVSDNASVTDMVTLAADMDNTLPAVYPNYYCTIFDTEDDAAAPADTDAINEKQWHHGKINTEAAWNNTKGAGVKVAIIDTGISQEHPQLKGNLVNAKAFGAYGNVEDPHGHGSHVSGIVAAINGNGVAGVAPEAKLYVGGVADNSSGRFAIDNAIKATKWATEQGVDVMNMSFGSTGYDENLDDAIQAAAKKGIAIVVAAGNDYMSLNKTKYYPACLKNVITVSATDQSDAKADFSNYGTGYIDVGAPGVDIWSTDKDGGYRYMDGTSMASPVVAGVAALVVGSGIVNDKTGLAKATAIKNAIKNAARPMNNEDYFGAGIVDADAAINSIVVSTEGDKDSVKAGESIQCKANTTGVTWSSSDAAVATVDANGKVTAASVTENKQVTITATKGSHSGSITLTVVVYGEGKIKKIMVGDGVNVVKNISLATSGTTSKTLKVWTKPMVATSSDFTCKSSNTRVATVVKSGDNIVVTAAGKKGSATITVATADGSKKKTTLKVTVVTPVTKITLKNSECPKITQEDAGFYPIAQGKKITVKASANSEATNKKVKWTNVNDTYYKIKNGVLTCKKDAPIGTVINVTATAADGLGATATMIFKVYGPTKNITLSNGKTKGTLKMPTYTYTPLQYNINGDNCFQDWTMVYWSNKRVAYLSSGYIVAIKKGKCQFKIKAIDGTKKTAVLNVVVK